MTVPAAPALALLQAVPDPGTLESPLPGGLATLVRFVFNVPQAVQIAGAVAGAAAVVVLAVLLWRRRREVLRWLRTRERKVYAGMAGAGVALVVLGTASGLWGWHYMQHDNDFCTGCHVMGPAFTRFTESEHSQLECHDCHQQPITASMRQLYLWVLDRPEEIGEHAPVPNAICGQCHIEEDPDSTWQHIVSAQGHRVHLESDHEALDDVICVTCHGVEVHRFVPADSTCAQSGCHLEEETSIVLGEMAGAQTTFHCVSCHRFAAPEVAPDPGTPATLTRRALMPAIEDCSGCHQMEPLLAGLIPEEDPHRALCSLCHDPHTDRAPEASFTTCAQSGCHEDAAEVSPFHRGIDHAIDDCGACHEAHGWVVQGNDCRSCHGVPTP